MDADTDLTMVISYHSVTIDATYAKHTTTIPLLHIIQCQLKSMRRHHPFTLGGFESFTACTHNHGASMKYPNDNY